MRTMYRSLSGEYFWATAITHASYTGSQGSFGWCRARHSDASSCYWWCGPRGLPHRNGGRRHQRWNSLGLPDMWSMRARMSCIDRARANDCRYETISSNERSPITSECPSSLGEYWDERSPMAWYRSRADYLDGGSWRGDHLWWHPGLFILGWLFRLISWEKSPNHPISI